MSVFVVLLAFVLLPLSALAGAGEPSAKYDARLRVMLAEYSSVHTNGSQLPVDRMLRVFVRGDGAVLKKEIEQRGGVVGAVLKFMVTARIPASRLEEIAALQSVERIEASAPVELDNDSSVVHISANRVHRGELPLVRPFTGKGVIVGLIDSGIHIPHKEFRDPNDSTRSRILAIWSHLVEQGAPPKGFDYGTEYTQQEIQSEIDEWGMHKILQNDNAVGHGTHVCATAAGVNGVAPEASIIVVQLNLQQSRQELTADLVDAVQYIYTKASELGMPCVINASLGQRYGMPHNGEDALAHAIDELVDEKPGRIFCASAGNDSELNTHWGGFQVEKDSLWIYTLRDESLYFEVPAASIETLELAVEVDSMSTTSGAPILKHVGSTAWTTPALVRDNGPVVTKLFYKNNGAPSDTASVITLAASDVSPGYIGLIISMQRTSGRYNIFRIKVRGSGTFHSWGYSYIKYPDITNGGLPFNDRYRGTDNRMQVGTPGTARRAITVASYRNRYTYRDMDGNEQPQIELYRRPTGELSSFSSFGPASDGRIKPDIAAPGELVVSARVPSRNEPASRLVGDGRYVINSGTSMSAPAVTGAVALYLEQHPLADFQEVYNVLTSTAEEDEFTESEGPLPNNSWGYGKLNIFAAMTRFASGVPALSAQQERVFPNPAPAVANVQFKLEKAQHVLLEVYDAFGRKQTTALDSELGAGEHTVAVATAALASGAYMYRLQTGEQTRTGVILVVR